jgi:phage tail-like protein
VSVQTSDPLLAKFFTLTVDSMDLGHWTQVQLGSVDVAIESYQEGGNQQFVHKIPGRVSYKNLKLTRLAGQETKLVASFFTSVAQGYQPSGAEVVALGRDYQPILTFTYLRVVPVSWTLPKFDVDGKKALVETIEFAHHGFTTS